MKLPVDYTKLTPVQRRLVREEYIKNQFGQCMYCNKSLDGAPPQDVTSKAIDWNLFPPGFLTHPVHLQHNHNTGMTEGAVHAYCNAVLWYYHGR
jgi:hypothetical protein